MPKLNINNKTDIPLKKITEVYEKYCESGDEGETYYEGKKDYVVFKYDKREYKMEIIYNITSITLIISYLDIVPKQQTFKGLKFPKLPKTGGNNER